MSPPRPPGPAPQHSCEGLAAVVLAGGYSSRMQAFKPLLPFAGSTVLERAIATFLAAGVSSISVVVGHHAEALRPVLERLPVRCVLNSSFERGMFTSVVAGIASLPAETQACFILPSDMPAVRPDTVAELARAWRRDFASVLYPVFAGQRGHPPLLSARLFPLILAGDAPDGLRGLLAQREAEASQLSVLDEGVLLDADTPDQLERLRATCADRTVPTRAECTALLAEAHTPVRVIRHGEAVASLACLLAGRLNRAGLGLDLALIDAAGRVHDFAKGAPDHASAGARELSRRGFTRLAEVVGAHTDLDLEQGVTLDESAIVYLADKLVLGDRVVGLGERFGAALQRCRDSEAARLAVVRRRSDAARVACAVEEVLGMDLGTWLATEGEATESEESETRAP